MSARLLVEALRDPARVCGFDGAQWNALISCARAERLIGTLACRLADREVPVPVALILQDARLDTAEGHRLARWEVDRMLHALAPLDVPVVLLKGSAYIAAGLRAGEGRSIGDLDILVPRDALPVVEEALLAGGWEWVKPDPYDDAYYRQWMHELPPLIHRERDRMIDVHHTILPLTAKPKPDAAAMIADSVVLGDGLRVLSPEDMVIHAAAHMLADGDLAGGLRNLWDIHCLCMEFSDAQADFFLSLAEQASSYNLSGPVMRALRLTNQIFGTPLVAYNSPARISYNEHWTDQLFRRRILSCDIWGRDRHKLTGLGFYLRSHLLRMPPKMLARHLFTKWRKGHRPI